MLYVRMQIWNSQECRVVHVHALASCPERLECPFVLGLGLWTSVNMALVIWPPSGGDRKWLSRIGFGSSCWVRKLERSLLPKVCLTLIASRTAAIDCVETESQRGGRRGA